MRAGQRIAPVIQFSLGFVEARDGVGRGAVRLMRTSLRYPYPTFGSGSEQDAPLVASGGKGLPMRAAVLEMALRRKVDADRDVQ